MDGITDEDLVKLAQVGFPGAEEQLIGLYELAARGIGKSHERDCLDSMAGYECAMAGMLHAITTYQTGRSMNFGRYCRMVMYSRVHSAFTAIRKKHIMASGWTVDADDWAA